MKFIADLIGALVVLGFACVGVIAVLSKVATWARAYNHNIVHSYEDATIIDQ